MTELAGSLEIPDCPARSAGPKRLAIITLGIRINLGLCSPSEAEGVDFRD